MYEPCKERNHLVNSKKISSVVLAGLLLLLIPALFLSPGCGIYHNVTTYFNTYYNAQHVFDDAIAEIERSPQKDRDTNYFAKYVVPTSTAAKFDSVIAKCSKVIQFHQDSKYVPDAILMIAKSYSY